MEKVCLFRQNDQSRPAGVRSPALLGAPAEMAQQRHCGRGIFQCPVDPAESLARANPEHRSSKQGWTGPFSCLGGIQLGESVAPQVLGEQREAGPRMGSKEGFIEEEVLCLRAT